MNDVAPISAIEPGASLAGGIYAGRFFVGDEPFALIVAPKAEGDLDDIKWNTSRKTVTGATSYCDGRANTDAMLAAGSNLAERIRALRIDGHDDWYLASRLEALIAFGALKGTPQFDFELDWYWTSTQHASGPDCAWFQVFNFGGQNDGLKGNLCRARAVRRIAIR